MSGMGSRRTRPQVPWVAVDVVVSVAVLAAVLLVADPDTRAVPQLPVTAVILAAAVCAVLPLRWRYPVPVLAVGTAGTTAVIMLGTGRTLLVLVPLLTLFTVAVVSDRRRLTWASWAGAALSFVVGGSLAGGASAYGPENFSYIAWTAAATAIGTAVRNRRAYVAAIEERAVRAEQTREEEARRRVAEERLRIARELHDVVAHHISVVNVQAGVAGHLMTTQPEAAKEALGHVRRASRAVLDEVTGILSVLRHPDDPLDPTAPAPGLTQLEPLVASFAAAGLAVDWSVTGQPYEVGDTVDLIAYRVLQEALTNAHKHGSGTAHVTVGYTSSSVALLVSNPVSGHSDESQPVAAGGGHGLLGMRERAAAIGGLLETAAGSDGQFRVEAVLPVPAAARPLRSPGP